MITNPNRRAAWPFPVGAQDEIVKDGEPSYVLNNGNAVLIGVPPDGYKTWEDYYADEVPAKNSEVAAWCEMLKKLGEEIEAEAKAERTEKVWSEVIKMCSK